MRIAATIIAFLVLAPAASAKPPNPCSLLSNAEAGKAIAGPIAQRLASSNQLGEVCTWKGKSLGGFEPTSRAVILTIYRSTQIDFERSFGIGDARIENLGALAYAANGGRAFLSAYRHGYTIDIEVAWVTAQLRAEKTLAAAALKRL